MLVIAAGLLWAVQGWPADRAGLIRIEGAIGPATAIYISRALERAAEQQFQCLVIQLDTPGGLLESTKVIVQQFLSASVPVVVYVAPEGATATSAGCFITLAADLAAMAPATSIGAAHPVALGGDTPGETQLDATTKQKHENYAMGFIEAIAAKRHRNVEWAKSSVKDSAVLTAEKALELGVIDLMAGNLPELLGKMDGREINGKILRSAGAQVIEVPMSAREKVLRLLRPEVMFILMLIAIYGIIGELSNPGALLPGVVGTIALVLVLYMAAILPINIAGLALILLAIGLFITDLFAPTHGILTVGGIIAFLIGALMLFDRAEPVFRLSLAIIIPATVVTALFFLFAIGAGLRAQRLPPQTGLETLLGKVTPALARIDPKGGKVFVDGELWNAVSDEPIETDQPVEIVAFSGLTLKVRPTAARRL